MECLEDVGRQGQERFAGSSRTAQVVSLVVGMDWSAVRIRQTIVVVVDLVVYQVANVGIGWSVAEQEGESANEGTALRRRDYPGVGIG